MFDFTKGYQSDYDIKKKTPQLVFEVEPDKVINSL